VVLGGSIDQVNPLGRGLLGPEVVRHVGLVGNLLGLGAERVRVCAHVGLDVSALGFAEEQRGDLGGQLGRGGEVVVVNVGHGLVQAEVDQLLRAVGIDLVPGPDVLAEEDVAVKLAHFTSLGQLMRGE